MVRILLTVILYSLCLSAWAAMPEKTQVLVSTDPAAPMAFRDWKNQQIREAQEALERVAGEPASLAANKGAQQKVVATELPSSRRIQVSGAPQPSKAQGREVRSAYESLQYAHDLGLEEYITVYLVNYRDDVKALTGLLERLSSEESAQLIQALMREKERRSAAEAAASPAVASHLRGVGGLGNNAKRK